MRRSSKGLHLAALAVSFVSCSADDPGSPLVVSAADYDFSSTPDLLPRLIDSPHTYFRFINREFTAEVCRRYGDMAEALPALNLHGDAHLEQYAVGDSGRGLTDFDDSAIGPGVVDLIRFGTSVMLTADRNGWSDHAGHFMDVFFDGLRAGVDQPDQRPPPPAVVERIRQEFSNDRLAILASIDSLMNPESVDTTRLEAGFDLYVEAIHEEYPDLPDTFFTSKKAGRLNLGVGSALDDKFLVRVEGPTSSADDDLILEIKQVRDLSGVECLQRRSSDAFQIKTGQSRIASQPYTYMGYIFLDPRRAESSEHGSDFWDGRTYWVHAWVNNYVEMDVDETFQSPGELEEVVYDIAVQLGRGHAKDIVAPHEFQLRRALTVWLDVYEDDVREAIAHMTAETLSAWRLFQRGLRGAN
jgi:hypothetical protein